VIIRIESGEVKDSHYPGITAIVDLINKVDDADVYFEQAKKVLEKDTQLGLQVCFILFSIILFLFSNAYIFRYLQVRVKKPTFWILLVSLLS
jgi:hypothetical protein